MSPGNAVDPSAKLDALAFELEYCALCSPTGSAVPPGLRAIEAPAGFYVEVKGGTGVYHQPDCYNVTGDWDGADQAHLGEVQLRSKQDIRERDLRPAQCCHPPTFR